jgi:hypothetical protein
MSLKKIVVHLSLAVILFSIGVYVLINKKLLLVGRTAVSAGVHEFDASGANFMAASFFIFASVFLLGLSPSKKIEKLNQFLLFLWLVTFSISFYI